MIDAPAMRDVTCHLCGSARSTPLYEKEKGGMTLRSVRCDDCGLVFTNPQPEPEDLARLYRGDLVEGEWGGPAYIAKQEQYEEPNRRRFRQRLALLRRTGVRGGRLLDVGAHLGFFLDEARKAGFDAAAGLELGTDAARYSRDRFGLDVRETLLEDAHFEGASFDVITGFHVFEHVADPGAFLDECRRILRPGGALVLEVPNRESRRARTAYASGDLARVFRPEKHLCDWAPAQFARMFAQHGFAEVRTLTIEDARAGRTAGAASPALARRVRGLGRRLPFLRTPYLAVKGALFPGHDNLMAVGRRRD